MVMAAAAAFFAVFAAGIAIGTADAFASGLFLTVNVKSRETDNNGDNNNDDYIFHNDCSFL